MKLGKIQLKWAKELEEHPERQLKGSLGRISKINGTVTCSLCCLGQGVVVADAIDIDTFEGYVLSGDECGLLNEKHQDLLGLRDDVGTVTTSILPKNHLFNKKIYDCLTNINDRHDSEETWVLIAKTMREFPEWAFVESK